MAGANVHDVTYRETFGDWEVQARHHKRQRFPRGHEIARQYAKAGRLYQMIDEPIYEWVVIRNGRVHTMLRENPNGTFHDGRRNFHTIKEAVETLQKGEK